MDKKEQAAVTVIGKDAVGILAKTATCCAEANANIYEVTQSVHEGYFTMMMLIEIDQLKGTIGELQQAIQKQLPNMEIHVMHENIFESMHRI